MKYDTKNLVVLTNAITICTFDVSITAASIVATSLNKPEWAWLFVGAGVLISALGLVFNWLIANKAQ